LCDSNIYTRIFQDAAVGKLSLPFPEGASGWKAEVSFASPVTRLKFKSNSSIVFKMAIS